MVDETRAGVVREPDPPPDLGPRSGPAGALTRAPGWREVLLVAVVVVAVVLGAAAVTGLLPRSGQDLVFRTPLAIVVLVLGTVGLLLRLGSRKPPG